MAGSFTALRLHPARILRAGLLLVALAAGPALAEDRANLLATREDGYGRLLLTFAGRNDLPSYRLRLDNGVLAIEFQEPVDFRLPDVAVTLPEFIAAARIDPDRRGIRLGLRMAASVNPLEAGERLFLDLLPPDWRGLPPGLPPEVVAELARRAKAAAANAEQQRKADAVKSLRPEATVRVGRNPTFTRVEFNWSVDTNARFSLLDGRADIAFDWPVNIDLYPLRAQLPEGLVAASSNHDLDGSTVRLHLTDEVRPRFYAVTPRQFVLDFDVDPAEGVKRALDAELAAAPQQAQTAVAAAEGTSVPDAAAPERQTRLVPEVAAVGPTVRITFPFSQETASAVFRRGRSVWMLFETGAAIEAPPLDGPLGGIASGFSVAAAGDAVVVRLDLAAERLATLGSEGRAWVLSLGDVLLSPTQPMALRRIRDDKGDFEMLADLAGASRRHRFNDPEVGDTLEVVTAFPPARGLVRSLDHVDFTALASIHGLVVRPKIEDLRIGLDGSGAVISAPQGLRLSDLEVARSLDGGKAPEFRRSYVDLNSDRQDDPAVLVQRRESLMARAAGGEGRQREAARLELARFFVANRFAEEALGVLGVIPETLEGEERRIRLRLLTAAANVMAHRPEEALKALDAPAFSEQIDALMWRGLARAEAGEVAAARSDMIAAESVLDSYPGWLRTRFLLAGARVALDGNDQAMAERYLGRIDPGGLDAGQASVFKLLNGRLVEAQGRLDEALDIYGQVIAADVPPTRAEAIYRTLSALDRVGRIDVGKAIATLSAEVLMWRGDRLETAMLTLLSDLYFRNGDYRLGFETVRQAARHAPRGASVDALLERAETVFADLYLDGAADGLGDIEALAIYYDFRELTPPGLAGDEMIRKLAERLVRVDLLPQAADLLEYQVQNRLRGAMQSRVATDLAVIRIANRDPEAALRAINRTRLAGLPPDLERQRRILEARALIDAGREDLALDLLSRIEGRDADLLRVDGFWRAGNHGRAAELIEVAYSGENGTAPLSQPARMNLVKAAVGFVLAGDAIGLSRLRVKFAGRLSQSAEWPLFDFVTGEFSPTSSAFREAARQVSGLDSLNAFLAAYRERYGGGALAPEAARPRGLV